VARSGGKSRSTSSHRAHTRKSPQKARGSTRGKTSPGVKTVNGRRVLTAAGRARREGRKRMGISDVRKASKSQIAAARRGGYLPGKAATNAGRGGAGFEQLHPRAAKGTSGGGRFVKKSSSGSSSSSSSRRSSSSSSSRRSSSKKGRSGKSNSGSASRGSRPVSTTLAVS
jgi:hypothetical protein